jgi:hypothetical protein
VPKRQDGTVITDADELDRFYSETLRALARGEVRRVPGYGNVRDFTLRPGVNAALHDAVMQSFHVQAALNPFMLESAATENDLNESRFNDAMEDIRRSIAVSGTAQVSYGLGGLTGHTVEVYNHYDFTDANGKKVTRLCVIDSNYRVCQPGTGTPSTPCNPLTTTYLSKNATSIPANDLTPGGVYCPRKMDVYHENWTYTSAGGQLVTGSSFQVDRQQDRLVRDNVSNLSRFCKRERGCE